MVQEIQRDRTKYAKRFNDEVDAIGQDIRSCETALGAKIAATRPRRKHSVGTKPAKTARRKSAASRK